MKTLSQKVLLNDDALVIRAQNVGENDRLLTLLTKEHGLIRAFASGANNHKNKKFAATSIFSFSEMSLSKSGETYKVTDARLSDSFFEISSDITALAMAQYFCELASVLVPEEVPAPEILRLLLNSLNFLKQGNKDFMLIKAVTELRIAALSGYMPDLVACRGCAAFEDEFMFFDLMHGVIYCNKCRPANEDLFRINMTVLTSMRHIIFSEFKKIYSFTIPERDLEVLNNITERYLTVKTERRFQTLDFYYSISEKV